MPTNFTHWRVRFEASFNGSSSFTRLAGFWVRSTVGGPNLLLTNPRSVASVTNNGPANVLDNNPNTYFASEYPPYADLRVTLPSGEDLVEFSIQATPQSAASISFSPRTFSLWGAWADGTWIKVAQYNETTAWSFGETRTFAVPAYDFPKTMQFVGRTATIVATDATGDDQITVSKATSFGVVDMRTYSLSKTMTYALTDNLTNGLAKVVLYAVVEEAPLPGQVDGFRMRNAVGRNVVMRGGKGEPPPPPPVHYPPGEIPQEPQ